MLMAVVLGCPSEQQQDEVIRLLCEQMQGDFLRQARLLAARPTGAPN